MIVNLGSNPNEVPIMVLKTSGIRDDATGIVMF